MCVYYIMCYSGDIQNSQLPFADIFVKYSFKGYWPPEPLRASHTVLTPLARGWPRRGPAPEAVAAAGQCSAARGPREPLRAPGCDGRVLAKGPKLGCASGPGQAARAAPPAGGDEWRRQQVQRGAPGFSGVPEFGASGPGGQSFTLETALLARHQPSEVAPQLASCYLVKPEVTSTSRNPPVPDADFSPNGREEGVRRMVLCITVRSLLPSRPKAGESGPRAEPSSAHHTPAPQPSSETAGHSRNRPPASRLSPACCARPPRRPRRRLLLFPTPPGGRFRSRVRACAPAAATAAVAARGSVRRETWCCFFGVKVLSNFRFLILSPGFWRA